MNASSIKNKGPKGPYLVHLSTMFHLFERSLRAAIFIYWSAKNTNLEEDVEILLSVKFRWILFSGPREVKNVSAN